MDGSRGGIVLRIIRRRFRNSRGRMDRVAYVIAFVLVYCDTRLRHDLGFFQSRILLLCYSIVYTTIT
jgi:hypothetical protein